LKIHAAPLLPITFWHKIEDAAVYGNYVEIHAAPLLPITV
jgi:hypothetical protein